MRMIASAVAGLVILTAACCPGSNGLRGNGRARTLAKRGTSMPDLLFKVPVSVGARGSASEVSEAATGSATSDSSGRSSGGFEQKSLLASDGGRIRAGVNLLSTVNMFFGNLSKE